jgi:hypothetical protein
MSSRHRNTVILKKVGDQAKNSVHLHQWHQGLCRDDHKPELWRLGGRNDDDKGMSMVIRMMLLHHTCPTLFFLCLSFDPLHSCSCCSKLSRSCSRTYRILSANASRLNTWYTIQRDQGAATVLPPQAAAASAPAVPHCTARQLRTV